MKHRWKWITAITISVVCGCVSQPALQGPKHYIWNESDVSPKKHGDNFNWAVGTPIEFLAVLKTNRNPYVVVGTHHNWIKESDIDALMALLNVATPCAPVKSVASSKFKGGLSTIGKEAAFLLEGYIYGFYPPELNSEDCQYGIRELQHWHQMWKTRRVATPVTP